MPIFGAVVLFVAHRAGILPEGEPLVVVAAMIEHATPTAMNMGLICTMVGLFEKESSIVLLAMHLCAIGSLTVWLALTLYALQP